jgi:hypothetical protein
LQWRNRGNRDSELRKRLIMEGKAVPKATILGFTEKQRDNSSKHEKIKT